MTKSADNYAPPPGSAASAALERAAVPIGPGVMSRTYAGEADLPALTALLDACTGENAGDTLRWLRSAQHLERVRQGTEASRIWLSPATAGAGASAVRFVACAAVGSPNGRFHIDPRARRAPYRRQGLGRAALRTGLQCLRERGMRWAVMQTGGANQASQRLFESEGFSTFERVPRLRYVKRAAAPNA